MTKEETYIEYALSNNCGEEFAFKIANKILDGGQLLYAKDDMQLYDISKQRYYTLILSHKKLELLACATAIACYAIVCYLNKDTIIEGALKIADKFCNLFVSNDTGISR